MSEWLGSGGGNFEGRLNARILETNRWWSRQGFRSIGEAIGLATVHETVHHTAYANAHDLPVPESGNTDHYHQSGFVDSRFPSPNTFLSEDAIKDLKKLLEIPWVIVNWESPELVLIRFIEGYDWCSQVSIHCLILMKIQINLRHILAAFALFALLGKFAIPRAQRLAIEKRVSDGDGSIDYSAETRSYSISFFNGCSQDSLDRISRLGNLAAVSSLSIYNQTTMIDLTPLETINLRLLRLQINSPRNDKFCGRLGPKTKVNLEFKSKEFDFTKSSEWLNNVDELDLVVNNRSVFRVLSGAKNVRSVRILFPSSDELDGSILEHPDFDSLTESLVDHPKLMYLNVGNVPKKRVTKQLPELPGLLTLGMWAESSDCFNRQFATKLPQLTELWLGGKLGKSQEIDLSVLSNFPKLKKVELSCLTPKASTFEQWLIKSDDRPCFPDFCHIELEKR
jgi:hypothetical protein